MSGVTINITRSIAVRLIPAAVATATDIAAAELSFVVAVVIRSYHDFSRYLSVFLTIVVSSSVMSLSLRVAEVTATELSEHEK
jgi:hypothetical protein